MFFHNFVYNFKILFRSKALIFWTFAFPLILGTLFFLAFKDIETKEKLDIFSIGIVEQENTEFERILKQAFVSLDDTSSEALFHIIYCDEDKAKNLLENNEITGYVLLSQDPKVVIGNNGIDETILKTVTETIVEQTAIFQTIFNEKGKEEGPLNPAIVMQNIEQEIQNKLNQIEEMIDDKSPQKLSYTMIEFYTLIAMTCLYGGMLAMTSVHKTLANQSCTGKRVMVTKAKKGILVFSSVLASFVVQLIGLSLLFLYTIFILKVDYGNELLFIILLSFMGSLAGLSLGSLVGILFKKNENTKVGVLLSITMLGCFLSGMMGITMKYMIDKNIPFLNLINPAAMITDGFYSLVFYESKSRFYFNILCLFLFSSLMIFLSIYGLKEDKYDSI